VVIRSAAASLASGPCISSEQIRGLNYDISVLICRTLARTIDHGVAKLAAAERISLVKRLSEAFRSLAQKSGLCIKPGVCVEGSRRPFTLAVAQKGFSSLAEHPGFLPARKLKT